MIEGVTIEIWIGKVKGIVHENLVNCDGRIAVWNEIPGWWGGHHERRCLPACYMVCGMG